MGLGPRYTTTADSDVHYIDDDHCVVAQLGRPCPATTDLAVDIDDLWHEVAESRRATDDTLGASGVWRASFPDGGLVPLGDQSVLALVATSRSPPRRFHDRVGHEPGLATDRRGYIGRGRRAGGARGSSRAPTSSCALLVPVRSPESIGSSSARTSPWRRAAQAARRRSSTSALDSDAFGLSPIRPRSVATKTRTGARRGSPAGSSARACPGIDAPHSRPRRHAGEGRRRLPCTARLLRGQRPTRRRRNAQTITAQSGGRPA